MYFSSTILIKLFTYLFILTYLLLLFNYYRHFINVNFILMLFNIIVLCKTDIC